MAHKPKPAPSVDPVWSSMRVEAENLVAREPLMASLAHACILHHGSFERALSFRIAQKLASPEMNELLIRELAEEAYANQPAIGLYARADVVAVFERDPACQSYLQPLLFFKGYLALQSYRVGHWLWTSGHRDLSYFVQMRTSEVFGVDIHPGARLGHGIMIDHAHSIVIGETAVVGDNVSMLHSVTLGGTGKEDGDRHPKIGNGVLIGAGAAVLGNITIGNCSRIAAGSVVLESVPPCTTVAGVPARVVGSAGCDQPSQMMDHLFGAAPAGDS
jgi:serine O-acetyltransferase